MSGCWIVIVPSWPGRRSRFRGMGLVDGPRAVLRRLVVVESEVDSERGLLDRRGEVEVGRRVEDGFAPRTTRSSTCRRKGRPPGPGSTRAGRPGRLDRIGQENGRPDVPEVEVHRVREGVDSRGGVLARDDDASPGGRLQVGHGRGDEGGALPPRPAGFVTLPTPSSAARAAAAAGRSRGESARRWSARTPPSRGRCRRRNSGPERRRGRSRPPAGGARTGARRGERRVLRRTVGVERDDDVGLREVVTNLDGASQTNLAPARTRSRPAASHWCHFAFGIAATSPLI